MNVLNSRSSNSSKSRFSTTTLWASILAVALLPPVLANELQEKETTQDKPVPTANKEPGADENEKQESGDTEVDLVEVLRKLKNKDLGLHAPDPPHVKKLIDDGILTEKQLSEASAVFAAVNLTYLLGMTDYKEELPKSTEAKESFAIYAKTVLSHELPISSAEYIKWQRYLDVLTLVKPETINDKITLDGDIVTLKELSYENFDFWLNSLYGWQKQEKPLEFLSKKLNELYSLCSVVDGYQSLRLTIAFSTIEDAISQTDANKIIAYIDKGIAYDREYAQEVLKEARTVDADWRKKLSIVTGFKCSDELTTYETATSNGSEWILEHSASFLAGNYFTFRKKDNPLQAITVDEEEFAICLKCMQFELLIEEAKSNYNRDQENAKALEAFQPATDIPIIHYRIFPEKYDGTLSHTYLDSIFMSCAFSKILGDNYSAPLPLLTDDPLTRIKANLDAITKDKTKEQYVILDFNCHGSPTELHFENSLNASDLIKLAEEYPTCKFFITTIACFGGGIIEEAECILRDKPEELKSRLVFNTQTSSRVPNSLSSVKDAENDGRELGGTPHQRELIRAILNDEAKTIGEGLKKADDSVRQYRNVDGATLINGKVSMNCHPVNHFV